MVASGTVYVEHVLAEDEEIIGIYGVKDQLSYLTSLGFIVWKPPRL